MGSQNLVKHLDRAITASLILMAAAAPLSIAGTQIGWSFSILFWIIRAFFVRSKLQKGGIELAIITFAGLTIVSSAFSLEPQVSLRKLVPVSLVTIVYLVSSNIRDRTIFRRLVVILLLAGTVAASYALGTFVIGKNLKVLKLAVDSPLITAGVLENDTILTANGQSVSSPAQLNDVFKAAPADASVELAVYRVENVWKYKVSIAGLVSKPDDASRFGIVEWSRGRDTRAAGFFGHYTTYAESVQLLLSLALGLLIVVPGGLFTRNRILLIVAVAACCGSLLLTLTRASWAGFFISAAVMILIAASRKVKVICVLLAIPIAFSGLIYLQQKRNVALVDSADGSTTWRMTVWRESVGVIASHPRYVAVGIGMDSLKTHWRDWQMFDNGNLPLGHLHSTPLQLAFERGVPALIAWLAWMFFYLRLLWRTMREKRLDWPERGVILGAFGGTIGFLSSGLVHYNWGDSEVVMLFYLLMGLSLAVINRNFPVSEAPSSV